MARRGLALLCAAALEVAWAGPARADRASVPDPDDPLFPSSADIQEFTFRTTARGVKATFEVRDLRRSDNVSFHVDFQMVEDPGFVYFATVKPKRGKYRATLAYMPNTVSTTKVRCPGLRVRAAGGSRDRLTFVVPSSCLSTPSGWRDIYAFTGDADIVDDVRVPDTVAYP